MDPLSNKGNMRLLGRFMGRLSCFFVVGAVVSALSIFNNYLLPQVIRVTSDSVIGSEPFDLPAFAVNAIDSFGGREFLRSNLWVCALAAIAFALLSGVCTYFYRYCVAKGSEGVIKRMRDGLYRHIQHLPYKWHVSISTGDIIQRCTSDVDVVRNFLANQMTEMFRIVAQVAIAMVFMYSMEPVLATVALVFVPITVAYSFIFYGRIAKRFLTADEAEGELSAAAQENFTGVRVVRAFGREADEIERFEQKNERFTSLWTRLGKVMGLYWGIGDLTTGLLVLSVVIGGAFMSSQGRLLPGEYLAFLYYTTMLTWPIRSFGRILSDMSKMNVSLTRLREILHAKEETDDPSGVTPDMDGDIVFDSVTFAYDENAPVLSKLSFKIERGTTFGILGGTGSGKSTITYLLTRLYDVREGNGAITVGGTDIRDMKLSWVRKNVGLVLQEPFLFSRTIAENIAAFTPDAPLEDIRAAARTAALDDTIMAFDKGYDTIIGERGVTLSGGQRQRVAIARTLMQHAPIMVFDDSLSAVDTDTDRRIREGLAKDTGNATSIIISHRITTLMHADRILVLDNGSASELGTHEELLKKGGIYRRVYEMQGAALAPNGGEAE